MDKIISALSNGAVVVVATGQQASHLRWHYARRQKALGRTAWPSPRVQLLSAWIEQGWEASLLAGGIGAEKALLTRSQSRQLWRQTLSADLEPSGPLLRLIDDAWRTLHDWDIALSDAGRYASGTDAGHFQQWAADYRDRCRRSGWVDSVAAMDELAAELATAPDRVPDQVLFVGFQNWQPGLARLAECLIAAGCDARPATVAPTGDPMLRRVEFAEQTAELDAAAAWAAEAWQQDPHGSIGLILPDLASAGAGLRRRVLDAVRPDWRQRCPDALPVGTAERQAFAEHGPVHVALLTLLLCSERMDYQTLGQLLRSPFLGGGASEAAERASLDAWLREHGQREVALALVEGRATDNAGDFGQRLKAAREQRRAGRQSPAGWADWITRYLAILGWPGDNPLSRDAGAGVKAWQELLNRFCQCGLVSGELDFGAARRMLAEMARTEIAPEPATGGGVQLLSPADALGHQFDRLWIGGLHSEAWPPPMRPNPLIPVTVQRQAGVPAACPDRHARQARELLEGLGRAAGRVVFSVAHRARDERLTPAPVLATIPLSDSDDLPGRRTPSLTESIAMSRETEVVPDPPPALASGEQARGGARLLQLQALCPARAFFELRLRARELAQPAFGIDAVTRGKLVHAALENLTNELREKGLTVAEPAAKEVARDVARRSLAGRLPPSPLNRVLAELELYRLVSLLDDLLDLDAARPAFQMLPPEAGLELKLAELDFRLRVDRIDALEAGDKLVIDYKTGAAKRRADWFGARPAEPQLPLYAVGSSARAVAYIRLSEDGVSIDGIAAGDTGIAGIQPLSKVRQSHLENWDDLLAEWRTTLAALAAEFAEGSCAIDAQSVDLAAGHYAPLTRVYDRTLSR